MSDNDHWEESEGFSDPNEVHVYEEVTIVSWWDRLLESVAGGVIGVLLFLVSFVILFFNEGSTDFSKIAKGAVVLPPAIASPAAQGKMVALTGNIASAPALGDQQYLQPGNYAILSRTVEMFAWDEDKDIETRTNPGGSETRTTRYTYRKEWTDEPEKSASFKHGNHFNPPKSIDNQLFKAATVTIGRYSIDMANLTRVLNFPFSCASPSRRYTQDNAGGITFPENSRVSLSPPLLTPLLTARSVVLVDNYLFQGRGTPQAPQVGDLRICYDAIPTQAVVTVFGQLQGDRIVPTLHQGKEVFFQLIWGDRHAAIVSLRSGYLRWLWFFRALGFLLMFVGLCLLMKPISVLLSPIPFVGDLVESLTTSASFVVALVLSAATILGSSLIYQPLVLVGSVAVTIVVLGLGKAILKSIRT
jgi:hypothetical protein